MFGRLRRSWAERVSARRTERDTGREKGAHNLFEAAAVYVSASAEDDRERMDEAAEWVSPEALSFGVSELACRAVIALARERGQSPQAVARALLGLPAA
ncbi:hypothetical protein AB0M97_25590 [Streptomyces sp. NPDC051207]|uniref:hypothetical protein n=1 Tax=Streptomyces sp. NPDC051207 TaxID=3154641 RepID=UPI00344A7005